MAEGLRVDHEMVADSDDKGGEKLANRRITTDERAYMSKQIDELIETGQTELGKYKNVLEYEFRDANYVLLKDHIESMKNAIAACGDSEVQASLNAYEQEFGTEKWKPEGKKIVSYPIALYQALLYTKADADTKKTLGKFGPCGCGIDGVFGLQTLLTSAEVIRPKYDHFHGIVDQTSLNYLMGLPSTPTDAPADQNSSSETAAKTTTQPETTDGTQDPAVAPGSPEGAKKSSSEKTPAELIKTKEKIDTDTVSIQAEVTKALDLKNNNDKAGAKAGLENAVTRYTTLIDEAKAYNLTQADEDKKINVDQLQMNLDATQKALDEVNGVETSDKSNIDVEKTVDEMRDAYKIGLIANKAAEVRGDMQTDIVSKVKGVERKNDLEEIADFQSGFASLETQIRAAKTSAEALKIRDTGMGYMLNPKTFLITTKFDATGKPMDTGEKLNIFGDNRDGVVTYLERKKSSTIAELNVSLAKADVAEMGISELPSFIGLDAEKNSAHVAWKEAIGKLDAQETKVAQGRKRVIDLMDELNRLKIEGEELVQDVAAEDSTITNTSGKRDKLKEMEARQVAIKERVAQLEGVTDVATGQKTGGEIKVAESELLLEEKKLTALKGNETTPGEEMQKSADYAKKVEAYGKNTLQLVTDWRTENMKKIEDELTENRITRTDKEDKLTKTKSDLSKKIEEIQMAIKAKKDISALQAERDTLLSTKVELEEALAQLDFSDRVAYLREYTTAHKALQVESNKLEDDKSVLTEQINTKKDRLENVLVGWSLAVKTQANAQHLGITETKNDAENDKKTLTTDAWNLVGEIYGGVPGVAEELTIKFPDSTEEVWKVESKEQNGQTLWTVGLKGSPKGLGAKSVPLEPIGEKSISLDAKRQFKTLQQAEVTSLQGVMTTWKEYVDAETRVHVLQQKIDIASNDIKAWQEAKTLYEKNLADVDAAAAEKKFKNNPELTDKTYDGVKTAYETLATKYYTAPDEYNDFYWTEMTSGDEKRISTVEEELATYEDYQDFIDEHAPKVSTAKKMIEESDKKQQKLTDDINKLEKKLTGDPDYQGKLQEVDKDKEKAKESIVGNTYWKTYEELVTDPKGRKNEDEKTTTD